MQLLCLSLVLMRCQPLRRALCALNHNVENGDKWKNIFYIQA
ncbi:acetyltransferase [Vibrio tarriae]|nr:acetyltransferase [Vibrio tarriae]